MIKHTSVVTARFTGVTRPSLRNGFNGLSRALPGDRAFLPPSLRGKSRKLDASVGASGPHDFAVRDRAVRLRAIRTPNAAASIASRLTSVTIAKRPSVWDGMAGVLKLIWVGGEAEYFCTQGWTAK